VANTTLNQNIILKEMINNSWSGLAIINFDTKFLYVNHAFSPLLGFSNEELLNIQFKDLILKEYKEEFEKLLNNNSKNQYINNMQLSCKRKDNINIFLDVTISLMDDKKYVVIEIHDITQSVSERELVNKYIIQTDIDLDGNITSASKAFCRLSGYKEEELIGSPYFTDLNTETTQEILRKIQLDGEISKIIRKTTKKKNNLWIESVIKQKHNKYGDLLGYIAVMFDITNEMALKKNKKFLQAQIIDREEKLKIMIDTMRLVAHEWRQPLNTISLEVQNLMLKYIMGDDVTNDETVNYLTSVTSRVEELSTVINDFQHTAEISENKTESTTQDIIEQAIISSQVEFDDIKIINNFKDTFLTFPNALSQSLAHILDNAKDATILYNTTDFKIHINVYSSKDKIIFEIINLGDSLSKNIMESMFTPYFSTKTIKNGVGLSLYNCKTIIELHLNGQVNAFNLDSNDISNTHKAVMLKVTIPIEIKE